MSAEAPQAFEAPSLAAIPGLAHGFFGREGGVSRGVYRSLNCGLGSADDADAVAENRARAAAALGLAGASVSTPHQVHGAEVAVIERPFGEAPRPRADVIVTATPGVVIGVLTADCAPILIAEPRARVIAAIHAGWRGAVGGALAAAVVAMARLGARPEAMIAAIGPAIGVANYEVAGDMRAAALSADPGSAAHFRDGAQAGRWFFDLEGQVARAARAAGVGEVVGLGLCTYGDPARFFSYRRATHSGEGDYGRELSAIALME